MSAKGTDGADGADADLLSISGTVQGDIYYNNGSAIARLPAGSANQVLQTNGTGANPSWGTVSSDFVKLATTENIDANTFDVNGYFSSTYDIYKIYINGVYWQNNNQDTVGLRFATGASYTVSTSDYVHAVLMAYSDSSQNVGSGSTTFSGNVYNQGQIYIGRNSGGYNANSNNNYEITLYNPLGSKWKYIFSNFTAYEDNASPFMPGFTGGIWQNTTPVTGLRFFGRSGNDFKADKLTLYGIKH